MCPNKLAKSCSRVGSTGNEFAAPCLDCIWQCQSISQTRCSTVMQGKLRPSDVHISKAAWSEKLQKIEFRGGGTCRFGGRRSKMSDIWSIYPLESMSSASSRISIRIFSLLSTFRLSMSYIRPGVPVATCTPSRRFVISLSSDAPPIQA